MSNADAVTYPSADWETQRSLIRYAGGFWYDMYAGQKLLLGFEAGVAMLRRQRQQEFNEILDSLDRHTTKTTRRVWWAPLTVYQSDMTSYAATALRYGTDEVFAAHTTNVFGGTVAQQEFKFPLPDDWQDVLLIADGVHTSQWTLVRGVEFSIDLVNRWLVFKLNPFDTLPAQAVIVDNQITDYAITLWAYCVDIVDNTAYNNFGSVLGLPRNDSKHYVDFMNAYADSIYNGPAHSQVCRMITAATGIPLVRNDTEVVELITNDGQSLIIATDLEAYVYPPNNDATVAVGDTVHMGDSLTTAVETHDLRSGEIPDSLPALTIGRGLLATTYVDGVVFVNDEVDVIVDEDHKSGRTFVKFALSGNPDTLEEFWDEVHARGIAQGTTLAEYLDVRESLPTQPTAASLPRTINPAQFLIETLLRYNTFLLIMRPGLLPTQRLGHAWLRHLRRALPPHVMVLTMFELQGSTGSAKLTVTDVLDAATDNPAASISDNPTVTDILLAPKYVNSTCL